MISFTIFVSVMVLLTSVWVTHARAIELGQDQEVASNIAQMVMEQSLDLGFSVNTTKSQAFNVTRTLRDQTYDSAYFYTVQVLDAANASLPVSHKVVVVKVEWEDSTANHTVSMESNAGW